MKKFAAIFCLFIISSTGFAGETNLSIISMNRSRAVSTDAKETYNNFCGLVSRSGLDSQQCNISHPVNNTLLQLMRDEATIAATEKSFSSQVNSDFAVMAIKINSLLEKMK